MVLVDIAICLFIVLLLAAANHISNDNNRFTM